MTQFWYSAMNASSSGAPKTVTIVVGALDAMFLLGALSELFESDNWSIDPDIDLGGLTEEEFKQGIADYWADLIISALDNWLEG